MAGSLNRAQIVGNLGGDPEIRRMLDGRPVATFSVATSDEWKDKTTGEKKEKVEWHRVVIFSEGLCGVAEKYCKKGGEVLIEGQLRTRKWEKDGVEHWTTEIVLSGFDSKLLLLGSPGGNRPPPPDSDPTGSAASGSSAPAGVAGGKRGDLDDEIPF